MTSLQKLIRPETIQSILLEFPEFRSDKVALTILKDSILLSSLQNVETLRKFNEKHRVIVAASELILTLIWIEPSVRRDNASQMVIDDMSDSSSSSSSDAGVPSTSADASSSRHITTDQLAVALALVRASNNSLAMIAQRNLTEPEQSGGGGAGTAAAASDGPSTSSPLPPRITSSMFSDALSQALSSAQTAATTTAPIIPDNTIVTPPADTQLNEARYASELQTMRDMGLLDDQVNLQALILCNGDVDAAINLLFSGAIA